MPAVLAALAFAACVQTTQPIYLDEDFATVRVEPVFLLPVVDGRADKLDFVTTTRNVQTAALDLIEAKGYEVEVVHSFATEVSRRSQDLWAMDGEALSALAPKVAAVFLLLHVDAVETESGDLGPVVRIKLSGTLVERSRGRVLWRDSTSATSSLSGLWVLMSRGSVDYQAAYNVVRVLLSTLPDATA